MQEKCSNKECENHWLKVLHHEREQLIEEVEKIIKDSYKKNGPIILDCPENTVLDEVYDAVISLLNK